MSVGSSSSREKWKLIQAILGTAEDGIPGPNDERAIAELKDLARSQGIIWHRGKASSFADPADVRAFKRCKEAGHTDQECFRVGDNGIGKWGADTTLPFPMVALPPEDWRHLQHPQGTKVIVEANGHTVLATLEDTMPHKENITNGAIIDLNPAACSALGLHVPVMVDARWRWA